MLVAAITSPTTGAPRPFTIAASTSDKTAGQNMCTPYLVRVIFIIFNTVGVSDYTPAMMQQLVFNIGDIRQNYIITILNDTECERDSNEQLFSNLNYITGKMPITINPMRAEVVIDDFDEKECGKTMMSSRTSNNHQLQI